MIDSDEAHLYCPGCGAETAWVVVEVRNASPANTRRILDDLIPIGDTLPRPLCEACKHP